MRMLVLFVTVTACLATLGKASGDESLPMAYSVKIEKWVDIEKVKKGKTEKSCYRDTLDFEFSVLQRIAGLELKLKKFTAALGSEGNPDSLEWPVRTKGARPIAWLESLDKAKPKIGIDIQGVVTAENVDERQSRLLESVLGTPRLYSPVSQRKGGSPVGLTIPEGAASGDTWEGVLTVVYDLNSANARYNKAHWPVDVPVRYTLNGKDGTYSVTGEVVKGTKLDIGRPKSEMHLKGTVFEGKIRAIYQKGRFTSSIWNIKGTCDMHADNNAEVELRIHLHWNGEVGFK